MSRRLGGYGRDLKRSGERMNNYLQETELEKGRKMRYLKDRLMMLCILMVISTVGYAQSFSNVPVDVGAVDPNSYQCDV